MLLKLAIKASETVSEGMESGRQIHTAEPCMP